MTPRQKKRLMRASTKGRPLAFIRFRAVSARMADATSRSILAIFDYVSGQKTAVEAIRDHMERELLSIVIEPMVKRMVRSFAEVCA